MDGVSFEARDGAITALLGPSGSGKSTVLRMIAGLEQPDGGRIWVDGEEHTDKTPQERRLGFVFQHYALFRHMTVRENVAFGLSGAQGAEGGPADARGRAARAGAAWRPFAERHPDQLSGGQRQRVALARALAPRPKVLLLDEPFGALDARVRQELRRWLDDLHRELGVTSLLVTHDQEEALELAQTVVVMRAGGVEQIGGSEDIYNRPATPFVAGFVGASNVVSGTVFEGHVHFGRSAVAGADHLLDGAQAQAYIRPHDVQVTRLPGPMSFPVEIERRTNMGWVSKLVLRLEDGQSLVAEIPNEELDGIRAGESREREPAEREGVRARHRDRRRRRSRPWCRHERGAGSRASRPADAHLRPDRLRAAGHAGAGRRPGGIAGQGRRHRPRPRHPAPVPAEHPDRAAPRGHRGQPARVGGRVPARPAGRIRSRWPRWSGRSVRPTGTPGQASSKRPPYAGAAAGLGDLWGAAYSSLETLLETVTLADVVAGGAPTPGLTVGAQVPPGLLSIQQEECRSPRFVKAAVARSIRSS